MTATARFLVVAVAVAAVGCGSDEDESLCVTEKFNCANQTEGFVRPDRCTADGDLEITIGHGEAEFTPLAEDELPGIHHGSQDGLHAWMGVRIGNAALDKYDTLKVRFELLYHITGGACAGGVKGTAGEDCVRTMGSRELMLGSNTPLRVLEDGTIEEFGIVVFVDYNPSGLWEVKLDVSDPCGRSTSIANQVFADDLAPPLQD